MLVRFGLVTANMIDNHPINGFELKGNLIQYSGIIMTVYKACNVYSMNDCGDRHSSEGDAELQKCYWFCNGTGNSLL